MSYYFTDFIRENAIPERADLLLSVVDFLNEQHYHSYVVAVDNLFMSADNLGTAQALDEVASVLHESLTRFIELLGISLNKDIMIPLHELLQLAQALDSIEGYDPVESVLESLGDYSDPVEQLSELLNLTNEGDVTELTLHVVNVESDLFETIEKIALYRTQLPEQEITLPTEKRNEKIAILKRMKQLKPGGPILGFLRFGGRVGFDIKSVFNLLEDDLIELSGMDLVVEMVGFVVASGSDNYMATLAELGELLLDSMALENYLHLTERYLRENDLWQH
ncbi:hypothetical protein [Endozoicomonas sp. ONNA1]|uniref:hypothetical protein n=1 Tax=Endozoicomonas sp. ONNA1 TaxID=2828740 RepID=UPI0021477C18|nr:hypothetical protein [Endozoicomonas sp. ONNA1]